MQYDHMLKKKKKIRYLFIFVKYPFNKGRNSVKNKQDLPIYNLKQHIPNSYAKYEEIVLKKWKPKYPQTDGHV